jgi:2-polyprenyl-3-methyl-5-hydroxy-6-metoxy-1,4-benzoquinol methylase
MDAKPAGGQRQCWCGDRRLSPFNDEYLACTGCGTLVSTVGLSPEATRVGSDEHDYYGKEYWLTHQDRDFGLPTIHQRARQDLPERCLHWLRTVLAYKLPPARVLELGCAHGGFVALLRWAGYDASGLEVSPWVVDYAKKTFGIPMLLGGIEEQLLPDQSFDVLVLNDLLEHLPDPVATVRRCVELLKPGGVIVLQTPDYPDEITHAQMKANQVPFLCFLDNKAVTVEHLYLFSKRSARMLLEVLGAGHIEFVRPMFPCDMFFVAGNSPLTKNTDEQIQQCLEANPSGRLVQALLDSDAQLRRISELRQTENAAAQQALTETHRNLHDLHMQVAAAHRANVAAALALRETQQRLAALEGLGPVALGLARRVHGLSRRMPRVKAMARWMFRRKAG